MIGPAVQDQAVLEREEAEDAVAGGEDLVEDELLVEDVSIDGMCGVY